MKTLAMEKFLHKLLIVVLFLFLAFQITFVVSANENTPSYQLTSNILGCFSFVYLINLALNKYKPKQHWQLATLVRKQIKKYGPNCDLNHIDVSKITDMSTLFMLSEFNGDISKWDVSNVKDMNSMFLDSKFNGDISNWNVSKVEDMHSMFNGSEFNGDISKWDVRNVKNMSFMFSGSKFNADISKWNVSKVSDMSFMFYDSVFDGNIVEWDVSSLDDINNMFSKSKFKGDKVPWFDDEDDDKLLPVPYWAEFEDSLARKNAVANYQLHKNLVVNLTNNTSKPNKRPKI